MTPMTPQAPQQQPVAPAALPLVALILTIVGLCIPILFPIGLVLAIVSLVKSGEPAYAARKTLAIVAVAMSLLIIPMIGILAAIAIPNFIKFQARSKQSECKSNLKSAYVAQKAFFAEKDQYGTTAGEIGFAVMGASRYLYVLGEGSQVEPTLSETPTRVLLQGIPDDLRSQLGIDGDCAHGECSVTMACAGNVDRDATIDVWSISTAPRTINGEQVPPGIPFQHVDDIAN